MAQEDIREERIFTCELTPTDQCEQTLKLSCADCPVARQKIITTFKNGRGGGYEIAMIKPSLSQLIGVLDQAPVDDETPVTIVHVRNGRFYDLSASLYRLSQVKYVSTKKIN